VTDLVRCLGQAKLAIGDFDNDGRIDAVVSSNDGSAHILQNATITSPWITLRLIQPPTIRERNFGWATI